VAPGTERIDPGLDRVPVPAEQVHAERGAPAIVAKGHHRRFVPAHGILTPVEEHARDLVVPVRIRIGLDDDIVTDDAFDGEPARVDFGRHPVDGDAVAGIVENGVLHGRASFLGCAHN
jgi:hypothetical protein